MKTVASLTLAAAALSMVAAFAPAPHASRSLLFRSPTALGAVAIPNPMKSLPWVAKKEKERETRRIKTESAKLHRELGIAEDATFEEIQEATQTLINRAEADGDVAHREQPEPDDRAGGVPGPAAAPTVDPA